MKRDWVTIITIVVALVILGLIYVIGPFDGSSIAGNSISSLSETSSVTQTIVGIALLFTLIISIFFAVNSSVGMIKANFHK